MEKIIRFVLVTLLTAMSLTTWAQEKDTFCGTKRVAEGGERGGFEHSH